MSLFRSDIPGWLHPNEVSSIERICGLLPVGTNILEIGGFAGRTTAIFAELCQHSDIYVVDPWWKSDNPPPLIGMPDYTGRPDVTANDAEQIFTDEILAKYPRVKSIKGQFPLCDPSIVNVGMVYWDTDSPLSADHDRIHNELFEAYSIVPVGGILAGHTFASWMPRVVSAVRGLAHRVSEDIILPPSGSIWYIRRSH